MDRNELLRLYGGDELHEIEIENSVSDDSIRKLRDWAQTTAYSHGHPYLNRYDFSDEVRLSTFTLPEGKLPKRIRAYFHKEYKMQLTADESKELTNMCAAIGRTCSNNHEKFFVHVGRRCFWQAGAFGDRGSCWFDNKRYHINQMHESPDFAAFTVYRKEGMPLNVEPNIPHPNFPEGVGGAGRMWLWFDKVKTDYLAAVSPYGLPDEKMIQILASMMPEYKYGSGSKVDYPYVPGYGKGLYDNGGYMLWPTKEQRPNIISPSFPNAKEER